MTAEPNYRSSDKRTGFSLVELLIVIAIVGVLAAIATPTYFALRARSLVVEAGQQVARDFERARLEARRLNRAASVVVVGGATEYVWVDTTGASRTVQLPAGTRFSDDADADVEFQPPYGTVGPVGSGVFVVGVEWSSAAFNVRRDVRVIGVMGKVVVQ